MIPITCPLCQSPIIQKRDNCFNCQKSESNLFTYYYDEQLSYEVKTNHYHYGVTKTHHTEIAYFNTLFKIVNFYKTINDFIVPFSIIEQWDGFSWKKVASFDEPIKINPNLINRFLNLKSFI